MQRLTNRALDYFETAADFRRVCGDAQSQARDESSQEFAAQMMLKANQYGLDTNISEKQLAWLCRLANIDPPSRRTR